MAVNQFKVWLALGGSTIHSADYFRIEQGCLWFRNVAIAGDKYPTTVVVYAPGQWLSVETVLDTADQNKQTNP